jgi:DNA segregation ATPase FtsK/SpoIIIE-like protein
MRCCQHALSLHAGRDTLGIMIKMVEMQAYQSLPHLAFPIVTDPKKVFVALRWLIDEMERRYARVGVRTLSGLMRSRRRKHKRTRC